MNNEEYQVQLATCQIVSDTLMARDGDEWLHEALSAENNAWLRVQRSLAVIIGDGLRGADDIDSVDHADVGRIVTQIVFDYIANAKPKALPIADLTAQKIADERADYADYLRDCERDERAEKAA